MDPSLPQDNLPLGERLARRWLDDWRGAAALVALLALASSITSITNGFAYDDVAIILDNQRIKDWHHLWRFFIEPYWMLEGYPRDLYRPVTLVSFGLQWMIGGGNPMVFHAVSILLYLMVCVATLALLRRLLPPRAAVVGASLWAVHPVHVEAVGNVVGQAEVMVGLVVITALWVFVRARQTGTFSSRTVVTLAVAYACALLVKEHAIVLPGLLVLAELALRRTREVPALDRPPLGWLLGRIMVWVTIAFLLVRWIILGRTAGSVHHTLVGLSDLQRILVASGLWPELLRLMLWPARLYADYSPPQFPLHLTFHPVHLVAGGLLVALAVLLWRAWVERDVAWFLGVCLFPVTYSVTSNLLFPTGVLIAERTLFLPSLAVSVLAGMGYERLHRRQPRAGWAARTLILVLLVAGIGRSASRQGDWADSLTVFSTMVTDSPNNGRGHVVIGQLFLNFGDTTRAASHLRAAYALHPGYGVMYADYLQRTGDCARALPLADSLLALFPGEEYARLIRVACLMAFRRLSAARREAADGVARGFNFRVYSDLRRITDSLLVSTDSVDGRNIWVRMGGKVDRKGTPIRVSIGVPPPGADRGLLYGGRRHRPP